MSKDEPTQNTKIPAVELLKTTSELQDAYCKAFEQRYHFNPVLEEPDIRVIRWAQKNLGPAKAKAALEQYLKMESDWFVKNTHSLRVFQSNVNQVMASVMVKRPNQPFRKLRITERVFCDYCPVIPEKSFWGNFIWLTCYPDELETLDRKCDDCKASGRNEVYKPSKEERGRIFDLADAKIQERSRLLNKSK